MHRPVATATKASATAITFLFVVNRRLLFFDMVISFYHQLAGVTSNY